MYRKLMTTVACVAALAAVSACQKKAGDTAQTASDAATNAAVTSNAAVTTAEDKTAEAVGAGSAAVDAQSDSGFVTAAAMSDMYEVAAAQMAQQRTRNPAVKAFAKEMEKAHKGTTAALTALLPTSGAKATPPTDLDQRRKGLLDNLTRAKDEDFDKIYIDQQVAAHNEAVSLFKGYSDASGSNAALKAWAAKTLPTIQGHLTMAKGVQSAMAAARK
jgi:putative membrane protein